MKNPFYLVYLILPSHNKELPHQRTSLDNIHMNCWHVLWTLYSYVLNFILLGRVSRIPDMTWNATSSTQCCFVALFSCYSTEPHSLFTLIYFCLHSPTSLHHHQHGPYCQLGGESLFTDESRRPPWGNTCMCIEEDCQSSLWIKCLNFQPSLHVQCWRMLMSAQPSVWRSMMTIPVSWSARINMKFRESPRCHPISKMIIGATSRRSSI